MEIPDMSTRLHDPSADSLLIGVAMATASVLLLRQSTEFPHSVDFVQIWPLFVIVLALAQMLTTLKERHQQGWGLLLAGDWLLANTMTNWTYVQFSVPLLLAGLSLMTIIRGLRDHSEQLEQDHRAAH
jgi:cell wall-active antibiotic response 4TMS protein YvqF